MVAELLLRLSLDSYREQSWPIARVALALTPKDHDVAWVAVHEGELKANDLTLRKEIAVFEESNQGIEFVAQGKTDFVLGSAVKHPHPLVLGTYSFTRSTSHSRQDGLKSSESGKSENCKGMVLGILF